MQSNILNKYAHPSKPEKMCELQSISPRAYENGMKQQLECIIFCKKKIAAKGYNFHSFGKTHTCSCHSEMDAIYKHMKILGLWKSFQYILYNSYKTTPVFHRLKGETVKTKLDEFSKRSPKKLKEKLKEKTQKYKMYIYRFLSNGEMSTAKPCAECSRWIYIASMIGINYDIYYTDDNGKLREFDYEYQSCTHYVPKHTYFSV